MVGRKKYEMITMITAVDTGTDNPKDSTYMSLDAMIPAIEKLAKDVVILDYEVVDLELTKIKENK